MDIYKENVEVARKITNRTKSDIKTYMPFMSFRVEVDLLVYDSLSTPMAQSYYEWICEYA